MSGEALYVRSQAISGDDELQMDAPDDDDDVWDDSLLIKAYNKAVDMAKEKIAKKIIIENGGDQNPKAVDGKSSSQKKKAGKCRNSSSKTSINWAVGMPCRAIFSADGLEYEATLTSIDSSSGTCTVLYIGYNNEETVEISSLKPSKGENARSAQELESSSYDAAGSGNFNSHTSPFPSERFNGEALGVIPPPPPPNVMAHFPKDESDALSAMLMAWYMSGYHTGYYQGLTRSKMCRVNGEGHSSSVRTPHPYQHS